MAVVIRRFAVFLVSLDPAQGVETAKTRPCLIVSPDEMNDGLATVIIAPMTTVRRHWPTRPEVNFQGKTGEIALDQIRTVDKSRLIRRLGQIDRSTGQRVLETLAEIFAP